MPFYSFEVRGGMRIPPLPLACNYTSHVEFDDDPLQVLDSIPNYIKHPHTHVGWKRNVIPFVLANSSLPQELKGEKRIKIKT